MANPVTTFQIIGEVPAFAENSQIVIEAELKLNSIIFFEKKDDATTAVKLVNLENLDNFNELIYRAGKGEQPGQIVFEQIEIATLKETIEAQNYLDELLGQTFDNLAFFYRDSDLSEDLINKYYPGLIVQERGFVDSSYHNGGLAAKHRFIIASSHGQNLSMLPGGNPAHGLVVIMKDSFFKVIDVAERENRKQITLLHIPEELVDFFNSGDELSSVEQQIAEVARADFDKIFSAEPVDVLRQADWLNRTTAPIGMSDEGEYFYVPTKNAG